LFAHSGGAGIAVWALEDLPDDVFVQSLYLLSPAISPKYDLSKALKHVNGHVYVFSSPGDIFVLGIGTSTFGTIDGVKTNAAGLKGFVQPDSAADPLQYAKLVALPYNPEWVKYNDFGDHIGPMSRAFSRSIIGPILLHGTIPSTMPATVPVAPGVVPGVLAAPLSINGQTPTTSPAEK